jgi:hypothetical protein
MLPEPLVEETPFLYIKGKRRAMIGLEVAEERERDASRQCRRDERAAAAIAVADTALEAREEERREEDLMEAAWVADTQLRLSQLSMMMMMIDRKILMEVSRSRTSLRWTPRWTPLTMGMMLGSAASLAAKLCLLRSHLVMRATIASLADLVASGVRPELLSHSCHRLRRVSYLRPVPRPDPEL